MKQIRRNHQSIDSANLPVSNRRGSVLMFAVICVGVSTLILAAIVKQSIQNHKQTRVQEQHLQARWLAESGLERGVFQVRKDKSFTGETWRPKINSTPGQVQIQVTKDQGDSGFRTIRVIAKWPADELQAGRCTRSTTITLRTQESDKTRPTQAPTAKENTDSVSDNKTESDQ